MNNFITNENKKAIHDKQMKKEQEAAEKKKRSAENLQRRIEANKERLELEKAFEFLLTNNPRQTISWWQTQKHKVASVENAITKGKKSASA